MRQRKCQLETCTVHYETRGEGKPIVLLHGGGPDRRSMIGCMEPILSKRKGWPRIFPDLPGLQNWQFMRVGDGVYRKVSHART
jgi:pimeloyl-ACP methyl ester carboxylesterase